MFVVSAIACGFWAYLNLKNSKKPNLEALSVLPDNCLIYFKTNNYFELNKKLNSQSLIVDKLKDFDGINRFCNTMQYFDSLFQTNESLQKQLEENPIHFAVYNNELNWLSAFNIKELGSQMLVQEQLSTKLGARRIEDDLFQFEILGKKKIYFTLNSGVVIASDSREIISAALNKALPKLSGNSAFLAFKNTLEESTLLSMYVNHRLYASANANQALALSGLCKNGYSSGTIDLEPSQVTLNGFLNPDSSEVFSALANQEAQAPEFITQLPYNCVTFQAYGFNSFTDLKKKLDKRFRASHKNFWKLVNDSALYNMENDYYENVENYLFGFETTLPLERYASIKLSDTLLGLEHLKFMSDSQFLENGTIIYQLKHAALEKNLKLFYPLLDNTINYGAYYQSYVFYAETKQALVALMTDLKSGLVINKNESFTTYKNQNFSEKFNYLLYATPNLMQESAKKVFKFKTHLQNKSFENFRHFSFSLINGTTQFKYRCQLTNETESTNKEQNSLWTLKLDTTCHKKVNLFTNHITHENEFLVQDEAKTLYLINAKGTILWKKNISEKMTSGIFTVDIFKNNKYQLLFSTKNYLHLIDRNGNYVNGYPLKLPQESTSELSVIDYDGDKDYRLFIACKNNLVYNYSIYGIRQEGFKPVRVESEINLPIQYVKVGKSDYLVAIDKEGKIYTFSRKGEARIGLKNKVATNCSAFYVDASSNINSTYLVYLEDKKNVMHKISFSDKNETVKLNLELNNAGIKFAQVDENKSMDMIVATGSEVVAYDFNGNLLFEWKNQTDLTKANFYSDEGHSFFYSFSETRQELLLFNQLNQRIKTHKATAMPLISNLFKDNKKYLIVTNGNTLNCFLLD